MAVFWAEYCKQNQPWLSKLNLLPNVCHHSQRRTCSLGVLLTVVMMWLSNGTNWLGRETLLGYPRIPLTGGIVWGKGRFRRQSLQNWVICGLGDCFYPLSFTCQGWEFDSHIFLFLIHFSLPCCCVKPREWWVKLTEQPAWGNLKLTVHKVLPDARHAQMETLLLTVPPAEANIQYCLLLP